jgi:hypothetical protein
MVSELCGLGRLMPRRRSYKAPPSRVRLADRHGLIGGVASDREVADQHRDSNSQSQIKALHSLAR